MERRYFLIGAAAGGIGLFQYAFFTGWMNQLRATRPRLHVKDYLRDGENAALAAITPVEDFYNVQKGVPEYVKANEWQLRVDGLVRQPLTFTLGDLRGLPAVERTITLECIDNRIGGPLIGNARWKGVELRALLAQAGVSPRAYYAAIYAADGLSSGHARERLESPDVILAYEMNGAPLTPSHGFPLRVLIPGKWGMKQPKWINRIEMLDRHYLGYWEGRGWSDACERGVHARFDDPDKLATLRGRSFLLTGYALGGREGVTSVEFSSDGGNTWARTDLFSHPTAAAWAFWKYTWNPTPGVYKLRTRGIDAAGRVQSEGPRGTFPDGATGQQIVRVEVV